MNSHKLSSANSEKNIFQIERIAFFSDAVFAIAITLLVIDLKVPEVIHKGTLEETWHAMDNLKYNLFSFMLSFSLIAIYWTRHHFLFKHVHNYDGQIIAVNMLVLLPIVMFPFTAAFFGESIENQQVFMLGLRLFLFNNVFVCLALYYFYRIAI